MINKHYYLELKLFLSYTYYNPCIYHHCFNKYAIQKNFLTFRNQNIISGHFFKLLSIIKILVFNFVEKKNVKEKWISKFFCIRSLDFLYVINKLFREPKYIFHTNIWIFNFKNNSKSHPCIHILSVNFTLFFKYFQSSSLLYSI